MPWITIPFQTANGKVSFSDCGRPTGPAWLTTVCVFSAQFQTPLSTFEYTSNNRGREAGNDRGASSRAGNSCPNRAHEIVSAPSSEVGRKFEPFEVVNRTLEVS